MSFSPLCYNSQELHALDCWDWKSVSTLRPQQHVALGASGKLSSGSRNHMPTLVRPIARVHITRRVWKILRPSLA